MKETLSETLMAASKTEKDPRVLLQITAIHMILVLKKNVKIVAKELVRSKNWAYKWLNRFQNEGLAGLRDRPRSGRPTKLEVSAVKQIVNETLDKYIGVEPVKLQHDIHKSTGVNYSPSNLRKILHKIGLKQKAARKVHVNKAGRRTVKRWQKHLPKEISRLKYEEYAIGILDEAFAVHDVKSGKRFWVPVDQEFKEISKKLQVTYNPLDHGKDL